MLGALVHKSCVMGEVMLSASLRSICLFLSLIVLSDVALAERRVALVIGNSAYRHAAELANPRNDATDMAAALHGARLRRHRRRRPRQGRRWTARSASSPRRSPAPTPRVFLLRRARAAGGRRELPRPGRCQAVRRPRRSTFETVRLDLIAADHGAEAKTNILFLDACRDNPLSRNLARAMGTRSAKIGRGLAPAEVGHRYADQLSPPSRAMSPSTARGVTRPLPMPSKSTSQPSSDVLGDLLVAVRNDVMQATAASRCRGSIRR